MLTYGLFRTIHRGIKQDFGDRFREHFRAPSPIHQHSQSTGHPVDLECFTIIDREAHQNHKESNAHPSE